MATAQTSGIGTLAYPYYVIEFARDAKPAPACGDATLFVLETRETFVWQGGAWKLYSVPFVAIDPAVLDDIRVSNRLVLRELRLLRQGMIRATAAAEYDGAPEELDDL